MRPEDLSDERLEQALRRQPRWERPSHFADAVIARMPVSRPTMAPPRSRGVLAVLRAAVLGALAASGALAAAVFLSWSMVEAIPGLFVIAAVYKMFLAGVTVTLIENAIPVAYIMAAVALSVAASVSGRAQEWI